MKLIVILLIEIFSNLIVNDWQGELMSYLSFPAIKEPNISISFLLRNADVLDVEVKDIIVGNKYPDICELTYSFTLDGNTFELLELKENIEERRHSLYELNDISYLGIKRYPYLVIIKEIHNIESLFVNVERINFYLENAGLQKIRLIFE